MSSKESPPPSTRILKFSDSKVPALTGGKYTITIDQQVTDSAGGVLSNNDQFPTATQKFEVHAPRFALDPSFIHAEHPPNGSVGNFDNRLAHVSLTRTTLPWEQELAEGLTGERMPWMALLLFAEGELPGDPHSEGTVNTSFTVQELLDLQNTSTGDADYHVLGPEIEPDTVADQVLAGVCSTIDVPAAVFTAVVPYGEQLTHLAHVRDVGDEPSFFRASELDMTDPGTYSVVMANRFPRTSGNYAAHLVSLEGFLEQLTSYGLPKGKDTVRLVSLRSWSFTSHPDPGGHFADVVKNLAAPGTDADHAHAAGQPSPEAALSLRLPPPINDESQEAIEVKNRLTWGYVPLSYVTAEGERTLSWYRGPLTPVPPSTVPGLQLPSNTQQDNGVDTKSSDDLLVYLPDWGVFDLSYAAAWTMGRLVALSHAPAGSAISQMQQQARAAALRVLSRLSTPPEISGLESGVSPALEELTGNWPALRRFHQLVGDGLAQRLERIPAADAARPAGTASVPANTAGSRAEWLRTALGREEVRTVLAEALTDEAGQVADIIEALYTLELVSFDHLVADPRMLPPESVRFFHVDSTWIAALVKGLASAGVSTTLDQALQETVTAAVTAHLDSRPPPPQAGLLLRSRLAKDWPGLIIEGSQGGNPVTIVRRDYLGPDLLLCLFDQVPDIVTLGQPHQDLYFGAEGDDYVIDLRYLKGDHPGAPISGATFSLKNLFRSPAPPGAAQPEVLQLSQVVNLLSTSLRNQQQLGTSEQVSPAGFAVQMIQSPHRQIFRQP